MTPSKTKLGKFIRVRRLELNLRQVPLSKLIGVGGNNIGMIETGKRKYLNDSQLVRLAKALQCDVEELRKRMPVKHIAQPNTELGKLIRSRREELGLTLKGFAKKMRMTPQQAKRLEVKKSPQITYYSLVTKLAKVLNLEPSALIRFVRGARKSTASELGLLIRNRRKELVMSISQLAGKLDVSRQYVNRVEFGQCSLSENDDMIERLAKVLKLDVNNLQAVRPIRKRMDTVNPLGEFLAAKRLELRLTQREIAERVDIHCNAVSRIERGWFHPNPNLLDKLAKVLDCQVPPELIPPPREHGNSHKPRGSGTRTFQ